MNLPQSTLHLPKTWWPAAAIIDPSFPMKLLGEQEKDNFAKLNPAQKARYRATGEGLESGEGGGVCIPVSQRHANERMPIYCNQCPPRTRRFSFEEKGVSGFERVVQERLVVHVRTWPRVGGSHHRIRR